jgi:hypothetical protein
MSGSVPMNGEATNVPISRRLSLLPLWGSATVVTSASEWWPDRADGTDRREQCTTLNGHRSSATSDGELGSNSVSESWTIGGGSITRRSRSPKPHARAARGC